MKRFYKVSFCDTFDRERNSIIVVSDNGCSLMHYFYDDLGINVRVSIPSFIEVIKYLFS